jgi:nucleoside-diphosphate-sugar epimerase
MLNHFSIPKESFNGPVLITGAGGCIGAWTTAMLLKANIEVIAFDLTSNKRRPELLINHEKLSKVPWVEGDISNTETVISTIEKYKPESIIHLAALQVPFCAADPTTGAKVNVVGTVNIMEAARQNSIKRIAHASSMAAHSFIPGSDSLKTLYGAYKMCDEQI